MRNPHNASLKTALAALGAGDADRRDVLQVLLAEGPLLLAADNQSVPGQVTARSMALRDGSVALIGFTSAPEVVDYSPTDAVAALTTHEVLDMARKNNRAAIVINPAGPSVAFWLTKIDP